jgi:hypothetical protein
MPRKAAETARKCAGRAIGAVGNASEFAVGSAESGVALARKRSIIKSAIHADAIRPTTLKVGPVCWGIAIRLTPYGHKQQ